MQPTELQPTELPQRTAMNGATPAEQTSEDATRALGGEVVELARTLPGDLRRLTVRSGDHEIQVEWATEPTAPTGARPVPAAAASTTGTSSIPPGVDPELPEDTVAVRAPLVGTFYAAPSPGADPFVRVGDEVESGQTLGIVEAMKLMNPIHAEEPGVVTEVLVGDAESVEYDQALMRLRPTGRPR